MATQVLFIRHGETDWNRIKRIQGHIDIPLATSGVDQAQRLAERFAREARQGERLDAIYSSDLMRAQQTAQPFADVLGLPLNLSKGLRERNYGVFQGHDSDEIALRFPDEFGRHKALDLIGDLALIGFPLLGRVEAYKAGHALHTQIVGRVLSDSSSWMITSREDRPVEAHAMAEAPAAD